MLGGRWEGPSRNMLIALATSSYLRTLRRLNLARAGHRENHSEMDVETTRVLGASPNLRGLDELDLS